ncbi:MbcA/ParS/Xre antitoxin family protein [Duganella radicis]|uniref:DUF2384 domain-containing protein n=1 Tax=Duganella radicis TaxID=551988 RepID=A0A6L6PJJ9_9BURK|nr:MbcA/ParS/Xre antitoxin family protein [Duganella radicis]MTV39163.1 DUF2384 domain-containing protein [Duganella radicis]
MTSATASKIPLPELESAIETLAIQVFKMVQESGNPAGFDASSWVRHWIHLPLPALGGKTPASYLSSSEGRRFISNVLAMTQSGAYA